MVVGSNENQAVGRGRARRCGPLERTQRLPHLDSPATAAADLDEHSHEGSHHLMGEGVGTYVEVDVGSTPAPVGVMHGTDEVLARFGLVLFRERREIVLAENAVRSEAHRVEVERLADVPHQLMQQRVGDIGVEKAVPIAPRNAREPGVEAVVGDRNAPHGDRGSEHPVEGSSKSVRFEVVGGGIEAHDLTLGVNTSIGAAGTRDRGRLAQHRGQRGFEVTLDRPHVGVCRKPMKRRAVVGDRHLDPDVTIGGWR